MDGVRSDSRHRHQIRIDVLIKHRSVVEHASLRVDVLDVILVGDAKDSLRSISTAQVQLPHQFSGEFLQDKPRVIHIQLPRKQIA